MSSTFSKAVQWAGLEFPRGRLCSPGPMFDTPAIIKILFDFTVGE